MYAITWWALPTAGIIVVHVARQTLFNHDKKNNHFPLFNIQIYVLILGQVVLENQLIVNKKKKTAMG